MITEITLKNFKCFKEKTRFPLSKINLLTGVNGGGKSSMLQALLLFKQSSKINLGLDNKLYLNGAVVDLGTLQDVKNSETELGSPIEIDLEYDKIELSQKQQQSGRYSFQYATTNFATDEGAIRVDIQDRHLHELFATFYAKDGSRKQAEGEPIAPMVYKFLISDPIHYIGADRVGPQNVYSYGNPDYFLKVDKQGKYAPYVLYDKRNEAVHNVLCLGQDAPTALQQTEAWLNEVFEGAKVELKAENDKISISYNTKNTPNRYKPSNVGFGYSYVLPIIISGLIAKKGEILIVENPEAHLHPAAQSRFSRRQA